MAKTVQMAINGPLVAISWPGGSKIEIINKDMKLIIYSPDNWVHIHEGRYMQYIRMQNKQMIICENISGSAGDPHWLQPRSIYVVF